MLLEPRMLAFCAAMILTYMAFSFHWTYYAVYLTEQVKLGNEWVGVANIVAMCVEIPVTFLCGWFMLKLGVKGVVALGMALMALRLGLIAVTNNPWVAVGTQVFHAFLILSVSIVPHTILDNRAGDRFRHSMQAMFVVMVSCGNALANLWAGSLAKYGYHVLFATGAGLCVAAAVMILTLWRDEPTPAPAAGAEPAGFEPIVPPVEPPAVTPVPDR
jgi:MFS family permease